MDELKELGRKAQRLYKHLKPVTVRKHVREGKYGLRGV